MSKRSTEPGRGPRSGETADAAAGGKRAYRPMQCDEIQAVLMDYLTHELGRAPAELVREHVRKCESCRGALAEFDDTLQLLRTAACEAPAPPARLSEERRRRVWRAYVHPFLDLVYTHHVLASLIAAAVALGVILAVVLAIRVFDFPYLKVSPTVLTDGHGWGFAKGPDGETTVILPPETGTPATNVAAPAGRP